MQTKNFPREKMPIIDTLKTAGVIGLLMQQTVSMPAVDTSILTKTPEQCSVACGYDKKSTAMSVSDALRFIDELTSTVRECYSSLANADIDQAAASIQALKLAGIGLIEDQLRAMDGTGKAVYKNASEERRSELKIILITVARARSAVSDLNHLIAQMTLPVAIFNSGIDRNALGELAEHGTEMLYSSRFH